jgi:hypothetical protein
MVKKTVQPLTGDELLKRIANNQSQIMFLVRGQAIEEILRNEETQYGNVLHKHPPTYAIDLTDPTTVFYVAR